MADNQQDPYYDEDKSAAAQETDSTSQEVDAAWKQAEQDAQSKQTVNEYLENQDYQAGQEAGSGEEVSYEDLGEAEEASQE